MGEDHVPEARPAAIVERHGWTHLLAPMRHAYDELGPVRADLASALGLPEDMRVFTGVHDSSANFYRYQVLGLSRMTVVSTGTWIVALSDHADLAALDETRGMTCNADIEGRPLGGCLTMGGRDFSRIAGEQPVGAQADEARLRTLALRGTMALPSFGQDDGLFPGSAARGRIVGPAPEDAADRLCLAVLYAALLTAECLDALGSRGTIILDGTFLRDPLYARLVAALRPDETVLNNEHGDGIAAGAALLARRGTPVPDTYRDLRSPAPLAWPELIPYAARWRAAANDLRDDRSPN